VRSGASSGAGAALVGCVSHIQPSPPVIVIGMHRSGTTMVTRVLEQLGVFMGADLIHNAESPFIVGLNDWLLWQGSGAWDRPESFKTVLEHPPVEDMALDYLRLMLASPYAGGFVGRQRMLRGQHVLRLDGRWGLKDPRMTYTLPLWLRLWPDAPVISMTRHGIDVASSLKVRADKKIEDYAARYHGKRRQYLLRPKHTRMAKLVSTLRCASLEGGFELWDEYATEADRHVAALGPDRALQLRYEDFLQQPQEGVAQIAAFCGLEAGPDTVERIAGGVNAGRAFAFEAREELRAFSTQDHVAEALRRHGYDSTVSDGVTSLTSP
jgi:hypothetical protein